jgi:transposase
MMIEGAVDGEVLGLWVEHLLAPQLRPGDIVVWDNVATHQNRHALSRIESAGARVEPLPAYSPDLNPIEECISKVKTELRRVKAGTPRKLGNALKRAFERITRRDTRGWFRHSGYAVT